MAAFWWHPRGRLRLSDLSVENEDELVTRYYEKDNAGDEVSRRPGTIFWCPILEFENDPWFAHIDRVDPYHEKGATFLIGKKRKNTDPFDHVPIKEAGLQVESNEALLVYKAKRRPVVLFSMQPKEWRLRSGRPADEVFLCIPSYTLEGYEPEQILAIKCLKYPTLFYLPADQAFNRKEAMLRFDRAQLVLTSYLERVSPHQRLTNDALTLIQGWFRYWSTGSPEDWILQYQKQQLERFDWA